MSKGPSVKPFLFGALFGTLAAVGGPAWVVLGGIAVGGSYILGRAIAHMRTHGIKSCLKMPKLDRPRRSRRQRVNEYSHEDYDTAQEMTFYDSESTIPRSSRMRRRNVHVNEYGEIFEE
jgi:hypothetical protein